MSHLKWTGPFGCSARLRPRAIWPWRNSRGALFVLQAGYAQAELCYNHEPAFLADDPGVADLSVKETGRVPPGTYRVYLP